MISVKNVPACVGSR